MRTVYTVVMGKKGQRKRNHSDIRTPEKDKGQDKGNKGNIQEPVGNIHLTNELPDLKKQKPSPETPCLAGEENTLDQSTMSNPNVESEGNEGEDICPDQPQW